MFDRHLTAWNLTAEGDPISTHSSHLLPVSRADGTPAMLKVAVEAEEKSGALLMEWWDGQGAARVLELDGDAVLLERAMGSQSLARMAGNGRDDEASHILCGVAATLHATRARLPPDLIPLRQWFGALEPAARTHGGLLQRSIEAAQSLLDDPQEIVVLHGDLHHGNVLDGGARAGSRSIPSAWSASAALNSPICSAIPTSSWASESRCSG